MANSKGDLKRRITLVLYKNILEEVDAMVITSSCLYPHPKCDVLSAIYRDLRASVQTLVVIRRLHNGREWQKEHDWLDTRSIRT